MKRGIFLLLVFLGYACSSHDPTAEVEGVVVAAHPLAAQAGADILDRGGNAFDAAVATHFALAVCYPRAGNLGGGGFAVLREKNGKATTLDFRETAPEAAYPQMYLDSDGQPIPNQSLAGGLAVAVPASVEGMWQMHQKYGRLPWNDLLTPAIQLAQNGVPITAREADILQRYQADLRQWNNEACPFVRDWKTGDTLIQTALAQTLVQIQSRGKDAFYRGATADAILTTTQKTGGILTHQDLQSYRAKWRDPLLIPYKDLRLITMPPPSSGGVALGQLMLGTAAFPLAQWGHQDPRSLHVMTELQRRVYADRARFLGDADFFPVPVDSLLRPEYMRWRFQDISLTEKTPSERIHSGTVTRIESHETTHYSIVDAEGNAVSITTTLNGNFGCKVWVPEAGFFLNNQMDDFSIKPGTPNQFGLVGGAANAILPGKRMLSSMTPTIVERQGDLWLVLGSPGGSTIITTVYQVILNLYEFGLSPADAVRAKRVHSQWLPDEVYLEARALDSASTAGLAAYGHHLKTWEAIGRVALVVRQPDGILLGIPDSTRGDDTAAYAR
ncbi:MAG: gamma-glutamyltransferase [Bernardetiaceae bacterium]